MEEHEASIKKKAKKAWLIIFTFITITLPILNWRNEVKSLFQDFFSDDIDVSGSWIIEDSIKVASYRPYINQNVKFDISLVQYPDKKIEGKGLKILALGKSLPSREMTEIEVSGRLKDDSIHFMIYEMGKRIHTSGEFRLKVKEKNVLIGVFKSNSANSSGNSIWKRK